ncbi:MAG: tetratricopeptide repeat protein, partial [Lachnospiraceae bacterium]|nr:tetratricopeptide repeat protein [Lachnospiraceae bacterium]
GYDGNEETIRKKAERNRSLLEEEYRLHPDDPYILYQLGQTYYMEHKYELALEYYDKMLSIDIDPRLEYVQNGVESYGYCLIETKQFEKALGLVGVYDTFAHTSDFVFLMGLIYMNNGMLDEAVNEFLKATTKKKEKVHGTSGFRAYYNIGVIYECVGMLQEAREYYEKAGNYEPAKMRLSKI